MFVDEKPLTLPALAPCQREIYRAIDYINQHGWCPYTIKDADGRVCIAGALWQANGHSCMAARRRINDAIGSDFIKWNDAPGRTKDEVIAMLQKAAAATFEIPTHTSEQRHSP